MKLKVVLLIDVIIIALAAGAYFYLQDQGLVKNESTPAEFILTDLTVNPTEAFVGEAVLISVNVTNIGDLEGNTTVNIEINNQVKHTANISLPGNFSEIVEYNNIESAEGEYTVKIGALNATLTIKPTPPKLSKIILSNLQIYPYESWVNEPIKVSATAQNPASQAQTITVNAFVNDVMVATQEVELQAGESQTVEFTITANTEGRQIAKLNTLSGSFSIVETGYHTLMINRSGGGSEALPFTLNGVEYKTAYTELLPVGEYSLEVPTPFSVGTGVLEFSYWSDGSQSASRNFTLNQRLILVATYTLISGYASCPSLYYWNGTEQVYVTEVSNAGWLGYIDYIFPNGSIVYGGGNPWDHIKIDYNKLGTVEVDGETYYDMVLFQQWDEIFYLDTAYLLLVDHPIGTDVYATMPNYINQAFNGEIYTVSKNNIFAPVSATNEKGENVLPQVLLLDGVFTPGVNGLESPAWNNINHNQLTLNLGDLSGAQQIKLVMTGIIDWGRPEHYYNLIDSFKDAANQGLIQDNTQIYPAPYMEIKDANGNWIRVPEDKQMPHPSDYVPRSFVVDLTGLFPEGITQYEIRITNFFNVTFDYIGIDVTTQDDIIIQTIKPTATLAPTEFGLSTSTAFGNFTRYGDVTPLLQAADDMYIIGMQGDTVYLKFQADNLSDPVEGMERSCFLFVACWFKDPPGNWGYGFDFTVEPLPFIAMSGFPYPNTESYPYDSDHIAYLEIYNNRTIIPP
jgi:hypothetical protein